MSNIPKLRFPEFTDAWEKCKLGEVVKERNEQYPKSNEYPLMAFISGQGIADKGERYNRDFLVSDEESKKYKRTELDDFIYSSNNLETGSIGLNRYGKACISPVYSIFYIDKSNDPYFIGQRLIQKDFIYQMTRYRQGVVYGQWRIHEKDFLKLSIIRPALPEQQKIGNLFKQLDRLITLHKRKWDDVILLKKALLQKMFPKNGSDFPEIRFPEFTDAWEKCKLGEVARFSKGSGYSKNDLVEHGKPIILYGRLYTNYQTIIDEIDTFTVEKNKSVISEGNEVLIPASGESAEEIARASAIEKSGIILGGDLNIIKILTKLSPHFLAITLSNGNQKLELSKKAQGKSVVHLRNSDLETVVLLHPTLPEQQKIGNLFKQLDRLITLHKRQHEHYQLLKKALLQQMFI